MSVSRETTVLIIVANLVLTSLVVAGAFLVFPPAAREAKPVDTAALEEAIARIENRLGAAEEKAEERHLAFADRLAELENMPRVAPESGSLSDSSAGGTDAAGAPAGPPNPAEALMKGFGQMLQARARQQRDQYIEELKNPTEQSERRRKRQFARIAGDVGRSLNLDERSQAEVERILLEVDDRRRVEFKALVDAKPSADDITFPEVKDVLDRSYEDEDRQVALSLGPEQAEEYKKAAEPFRQMIYMGAKSAFAAPATDENR